MVFAQSVFEKSCGAYHEKLAETTLASIAIARMRFPSFCRI